MITSGAVFSGITENRIEYTVPHNDSLRTDFLCAPGIGGGTLLILASLSFANANSTASYVGLARLSYSSGDITKVDIAESTSHVLYKISEKISYSNISGFLTINNPMAVDLEVAIIPNRLTLYRHT